MVQEFANILIYQFCLPYRVDSVVTTLYDGFADNDMLSSVVGAELCGLSPVA